MKTQLCIAVVFFALFRVALGREASEQARIDFLIRTVETAKGIVFIWNSADYDGGAAAKHLRVKLGYAGERVRTAEQFVKACASESSLTHQKYKVRLPDGKTIDASEFFESKLREFDAGKK